MLEINKFDKIIVANWKLNGSLEFLKTFFDNFDKKLIDPSVCGIICPPSIYFNKFSSKIHPLFLGAQNCSNFENGAYTGEISASMLKDNDCQFCIVGHSERREVFKETNEDIFLKIQNLIKKSINPILCIGENLDQKNNGDTKKVLYEQLSRSLPNESSNNSLIIAYEPIWAIGTGVTPTIEEIYDIHSFIKKDIKKFENYKLLYGGSVKSDNVKEIIELENVDGVLVGGASLNPFEFAKILNS